MSVDSPDTKRARRSSGPKIPSFLLVWPERNHWRRYLLGGAVSAIGVWILAIAYYKLSPVTYTSRWTFILPGSGAGVSVNLDSIGQASSQSASPFSTPTLSPKVIYREIATSDKVLAAAADSLEMKFRDFGAPRVKLIDETALMNFEITGRQPEVAKAKADALIKAFMNELDALRKDEIDRRALSVRDTLKSYQENLVAARQRLYDAQQEGGIISVDQFNEMASSLEEARRKMRDVRSDFERLDAEQTTLIDRLGLPPSIANIALQLAADAVFMKTLGDYAEASTAVKTQAQLVGPNNPVLVRERVRQDSALATLKKLTRSYGIDAQKYLPRIVNIFNVKAREELLKQLVTNEASIDGKRRELAALEQTSAEQEQRVKELNAIAGRLENLKKDLIVAEAVFTSAVARLDTNRADVFASYPLTQVLAAPDLPESRSSPLLGFAIAGGFAGTLMSSAAWALAWMRQLFVRKRQKKPSSATA